MSAQGKAQAPVAFAERNEASFGDELRLASRRTLGGFNGGGFNGGGFDGSGFDGSGLQHGAVVGLVRFPNPEGTRVTIAYAAIAGTEARGSLRTYPLGDNI